jgi:hypothetical protein
MNADAVTVPEEEKLPPGGFGLKHGFPQWFGRTPRSTNSSRNVSGSQPESTGTQTPVASEQEAPQPDAAAQGSAEEVLDEQEELKSPAEITVAEILTYIQSTFTEESVLDSLSITTAANPGALHAWRAYRADKEGSDRSSPPQAGGSDSSKLRLAYHVLKASLSYDRCVCITGERSIGLEVEWRMGRASPQRQGRKHFRVCIVRGGTRYW